MESFFAIFADSSDAVFICFMFVSFVFLSNLTVVDCIINENVMLLFIKNEHFTLLNSVCFWETSPRPLTRGFAAGPHWRLSPQTPLQPRAPALGIYYVRPLNNFTGERKATFAPPTFKKINTLFGLRPPNPEIGSPALVTTDKGSFKNEKRV